jgi:hypothetical protein
MMTRFIVALVLLSTTDAAAHDCSSADDCGNVVTNSGWLDGLLAALLAYVSTKREKKPRKEDDQDPTITIAPAESTACPNQSTSYTATYQPPDASVRWQASGGSPTEGVGDTFSVRHSNSGEHHVTGIVTTTSGREAAATVSVHIRRKSGAAWAGDAPGSSDPNDLVNPFRTNLMTFLQAVATSGAQFSIRETYRSPQRCYLMHYSWRISRPEGNQYHIDAQQVPPFDGLPICWAHLSDDGEYDKNASVSGASALVAALGIDSTLPKPPALHSRHTDRTAADVRITWTGNITVARLDGTSLLIDTEPRNSLNDQLSAVGLTYGVKHFAFSPQNDKNHWSTDGH